MNPPIISIITVTYNAERVLEGTIESVLSQTYSNVEYIVIDGASKDGTVSIIRRYEHRLAHWLSEPDKGLYDAMNKGLALAKGDFVLFLNAGDYLHTPHTLAQVMAQCSPLADALYGEIMLVNDAREPLGTRSERTTQRVPERLTWRSFRYGMVVSHQAFLLRRKLASPYRTDNLCADIDWIIQGLKHAREVVHTHLTIADYLVGGLSKKRHEQSLKDRFQVLSEHYGWLPNVAAHALIVGRSIWYKKVKRKEVY